MKSIDAECTVGEIATQVPGITGIFESLGIDYCCGGRKTLDEVCREKGLDSGAVLNMLQDNDRAAAGGARSPDVSEMSLTELVDHIQNTHHAYLHAELPRLAKMTQTVASIHGKSDPRLHQVRETFRAMALELWQHMFKEEECLFPLVRQLEASERTPSVHCGTVANPIRQMEIEHDDAGSALERLRELTDGYSPPASACQTYRALLTGLAFLERDMHLHIHKENNVLFPHALKIEALRQRGVPVA
jgi:regulator of cell morphogenesis and NO signaling